MRVECVFRRTFFVEAGEPSVSSLRESVSERTGVPAPLLRLQCGGRELHDAMPLDAAMLSMPVRAMLRVVGGKGGFGSMLRTAGAKGIKTTNFDACRDLNGRRLRHVNNETRLREWEAQADERKRRKLEQQARDSAANKPAPAPRFDDDEYDEMLEATRKRVSDAVAASALVPSSSAADSGEASSSDAATATAAIATASGRSGKRPASALVEVPAAGPAKPEGAKLWADPLAALGGEGSSSDDSDGAD